MQCVQVLADPAADRPTRTLRAEALRDLGLIFQVRDAGCHASDADPTHVTACCCPRSKRGVCQPPGAAAALPQAGEALQPFSGSIHKVWDLISVSLCQITCK